MAFRGGRYYRQSEELKDFIRRRDDYTCQICGKPGYDVDHIEPWYISHDSTPTNLRVLCHKCNIATRRNPRANPFTTLDLWAEHLKELITCT